jgi:protein-tyrosine kinase
MERIQEALAKARAQRQQGSTTRTEHAAPQAPRRPVDEIWSALDLFKLNRAALKRHRIVAVDIGRDTAPYDILRTKIIHQAHTNGWRRVAFVSPDKGAGKSTTLANLAFSFGRHRDMRVMCFDFDFRRPALHRLLGQTPDHSMADVLNGHVKFAEHGLRMGDRVGFGLSNGPAVSPSDLLLSQKSRTVIDEIEQSYGPDLMLFDMSPLNVSDDNIAFLKNVDCAVILAAAESTPMGRIDHAERQVAELTNVMGIVLNKCRYTSEAEDHEYY